MESANIFAENDIKKLAETYIIIPLIIKNCRETNNMKEKQLKQNISQDELVRINKFLSDAGVCSRREADRL